MQIHCGCKPLVSNMHMERFLQILFPQICRILNGNYSKLFFLLTNYLKLLDTTKNENRLIILSLYNCNELRFSNLKNNYFIVLSLNRMERKEMNKKFFKKNYVFG